MKYMSIVFLLVVVIAAGCTPQATSQNDLAVAATFFPLYDLTRSIAGDRASVSSIVPAGAEPHGFEPNPSDLQRLAEADVFVTNGLEFAEFEEDLANVNPTALIIVASDGIEVLSGDHHDDHGDEDHADDHDEHETDEHDHEEHEDEGHDHDDDVHEADEHNHEEHEDEAHDHDEDEADEHEHAHGLYDPHVWLSPKNAQKIVMNVLHGLAEADPANAEYYRANSEQVIEDLKALDADFAAGLSSCQKDTILVNHNAFSYLARDYGFEVIGIAGLEPEAEPTPQQLATLIEEAREHDLKYLFYEELVDSRIAETIAKEAGAQTLELSPLEGTNDLSATYFSLMRQNLKNLEVALECQ